MARNQQDPLVEILNLWSFTTQENQTLQLTLHPLQRSVNQAKLAEALEEANVRVVNMIGVDLHLAVNHDHMHILFSFVCGLGPRKAKRLIQNLKRQDKPVAMRSNLFNEGLLSRDVSFQANPFFKIRLSPSDNNERQQIHLLDQTRIPIESYKLALKIASDCVQNSSTEKLDQYLAVKQVLMDPRKLDEFDIEKYRQEIRETGQPHMSIFAEFIIRELKQPMKDPREYRTFANANPPNEALFYMLIEENRQSFKDGMIVTATVVRIVDNRENQSGKPSPGYALCRLDNGLEARIDQSSIDNPENRRLNDLLKPGFVVTGRIDKLQNTEENRFAVILNCQRKTLESHISYAKRAFPPTMLIPEEDLEN